MEVIKISNINKRYGKSIVLNNISLNIENEEIVGLIGPSGAGKSTLVKAIMGMEKIDSGEIRLLNVKIPNLKILNKIGYMSQSDALYEDLSGRENLQFFAKLYKMSKEHIEERIEYLSKLVNLEKDLNKKVSKYSGGMKRRLSLAMALIQDPEVFILDEPTVGIDPTLRASIWKEINNLKSKGKSIVITTHVMDEAIKCDKLALINEGKIIAYGRPDELIEKYEVISIEEIFIKMGSED